MCEVVLSQTRHGVLEIDCTSLCLLHFVSLGLLHPMCELCVDQHKRVVGCYCMLIIFAAHTKGTVWN